MWRKCKELLLTLQLVRQNECIISKSSSDLTSQALVIKCAILSPFSWRKWPELFQGCYPQLLCLSPWQNRVLVTIRLCIMVLLLVLYQKLAVSAPALKLPKRISLFPTGLQTSFFFPPKIRAEVLGHSHTLENCGVCIDNSKMLE